MMPADAARFMARALRLAERGRHTTHPNPRVGCVVVNDGEIVGEGAHLRAGEPHAEVHALRAAGERARGADLFVTLEPCAHHGRTPPCADALVAAGVARVVIAAEDPFPKVAGRGIEKLRAAGIVIQHGVAQLTPLAVGEALAAQLEVPSGTLLFELDQLDYEANGTPVLYSLEHLVAGLLSVQVYRRGPG